MSKKKTKDKKSKEVRVKVKNSVPWLKPYQFKPGQSGNPSGSSKKQTMKEYMKKRFLEMNDKEKVAFLNKIDPSFAWRMAEGNPQNDVTSGGEPIYDSLKDVPTEDLKNIAESGEEGTS